MRGSRKDSSEYCDRRYPGGGAARKKRGYACHPGPASGRFRARGNRRVIRANPWCRQSLYAWTDAAIFPENRLSCRLLSGSYMLVSCRCRNQRHRDLNTFDRIPLATDKLFLRNPGFYNQTQYFSQVRQQFNAHAFLKFFRIRTADNQDPAPLFTVQGNDYR